MSVHLKYSKGSMVLHWLTAVLIVCTFALGVTMVNMDGISMAKLRYFSWHKWMGVTVLGLSCARLLWRLANPAPAYPQSMPTWQKMAANVLHGVLYVLIFLVPISGYLYTLAAGVPVVYLGLFPLPVFISPDPELKMVFREVHYTLNLLLLASFGVHLMAALKHQFVDRDDIFKRMLP